MSSMAARSTCGFSVVGGWSSFEYVATAETARVMARAYGVEAAVRCWALIMRDAAMSSNAFVIFCVAFTDRIRLRYSRSCPAISAPLLPDDALLADVLRVHRLGRLVPRQDAGLRATDEVPL